MKITGIEIHVLVGQLEGQSFGWSQRVTGTRQAVLCSITTDTGLEGVGEAFYFGGPATVVATLIREGFGPAVGRPRPDGHVRDLGCPL
jgi:L-alanine-DL-glutamate epimerase-like enolase superfamily enzyme